MLDLIFSSSSLILIPTPYVGIVGKVCSAIRLRQNHGNPRKNSNLRTVWIVLFIRNVIYFFYPYIFNSYFELLMCSV